MARLAHASTHPPSSPSSEAETSPPVLVGTDMNDSIDESERADLEETANGLLAELRVWDQASNFTPFHLRTQYGNHCYRHAMRIWILRNVFSVEGDDERVIAAVKAIVELGKELIAQYGIINWFVPPFDLPLSTECTRQDDLAYPYRRLSHG